MSEQALPIGRRVAWEAVTTGILLGFGFMLTDSLDAPGWVVLAVFVLCAFCAPSIGRRLALWVDRR